MFEDYFFDKRTTTTYQVFRLMKAHATTNFTINRLTQESGLSYSQTYNAYQEIMADVQEMYPGKPVTNTSEGFTQVAGPLTVDEYRFHLLNQSMAFRFFDYAFRTGAANVHQFCATTATSISTLRRRIAPFRRYMQGKEIRLDASTWAPDGSETQIRLLILTFYLLAYRGVGWPFSEAAFKKAKAAFDLLNQKRRGGLYTPTAVPNKQDLMILAIQAMRIRSGHVVSPSEQLPALFAPDDTSRQVYSTAHFPDLSPAALECERNHYDLCRMHYVSMRETLTAQDQIIMERLAVPDTPVHRFAQGLLDFLLAACDPSTPEARPENHAVLLANLHRIAFSYLNLDGRFATRLDFLNRDANEAKKGRLPALIREYFDQLQPEAVGALAEYYSTMYLQLYTVIAPDFPELNVDHQLKVTVIVDEGTFMSRDLFTFLKGLHYVKLIPPDAQKLPDVIITTLNTNGVLDRYYSAERLARVRVINWQLAPEQDDFYNLMNTLYKVRPQMLAARD
ncbi:MULTISPECIES: helix-turn-helix domain-containing protein [unclassified Lacticaseibacillus]|uniref:helix-turn-helix domain-containing protein n=1 Tax=unclassified Lacticaseibacillus TaxID=2759744 RepID=UPI001941BAFB|nr:MULTISPECIES: helix-turn-helix domain-containing protein [unclassified Lacticaseibacillus]